METIEADFWTVEPFLQELSMMEAASGIPPGLLASQFIFLGELLILLCIKPYCAF